MTRPAASLANLVPPRTGKDAPGAVPFGDPRFARCQHVHPNGKPCRHPVAAHRVWCRWHDPDGPPRDPVRQWGKPKAKRDPGRVVSTAHKRLTALRQAMGGAWPRDLAAHPAFDPPDTSDATPDRARLLKAVELATAWHTREQDGGTAWRATLARHASPGDG